MFTRAFWLAAAERVVGTVLVSIAASAAATGNLLDVDWPTALGTAGALALASLAASAGKTRIGEPGTPSLVPAGRHAKPE